MEEAVVKNPNLQNSTKYPKGREEFWRIYLKGGIGAIMAVYGKDNRKQKIKYMIKGVIRGLGLMKLAKKILKK